MPTASLCAVIYMDRDLLSYYPRQLRSLREIQAIAYAQERALSKLWEGANNALRDQFICSATQYGVSRWEGILGISPKGTDTLDDRRFRVKARLGEQLPYTLGALHARLEALCGADNYSLELPVGSYTLSVKVGLAARSNFDDVKVLLERLVPANIAVLLTLKYNPHEIYAQYAHDKLAPFTHEMLRNEVIS